MSESVLLSALPVLLRLMLAKRLGSIRNFPKSSATFTLFCLNLISKRFLKSSLLLVFCFFINPISGIVKKWD